MEQMDQGTRPSTILFQSRSTLLALCAWRQIRRAQRIILFEHQGFLEERHLSRENRFFERWIQFIHRGATLSVLPQETLISLWHRNNMESDRIVERTFQTIRMSASMRLMQRLLKSQPIEAYYTIRLLPWILSETLFYRTAHAVSSDCELVLIPSSDDPHQFHRDILGDNRWQQAVPGLVRSVLKIRARIIRAAHAVSGTALIRLILYSLEPLIRLCLRGRLSMKARQHRADILIPLATLFRDDKEAKWMGHDMAFLLGGRLDASRCAFYFADWQLSRQEKERQKDLIAKQGFRSIDPDDFRGDPSFLGETARFCIQLWMGATRPSLLAEDPRVNLVSAGLARNYLRELLFARSVEFKALVEFQDYSPVHVVRTVVANRYGRLTVGMHHANPAATAVLPVTRYSHINRLCVWGRAFVKMHEPHWNTRHLIPMGAYPSDFILSAQHSPRAQQLEERYRSSFGGIRPLIVFLFPSLGRHILASRVEELLSGLSLLRSLSGEFLLVCRFRNAPLKEEWLTRGLAEIMRSDSRIVEDSKTFDTYEWMGLSNFVISSGHSAAVIEAAAAGKPCAVFDQMLSGELVFGRFGKNLLLKTGDDLLRTVKKVQSGDISFQDGPAALAEDFSYFSDGQCIARFRQAILDAAHDAEASTGAKSFSFQSRLVSREPMPVVA